MGWRSGISTYGLPHVQSYGDAVRVWNKANLIRNNPTKRWLKIGDRTKYIELVKITNTINDFALGYNGDQVIYHADNSITIYVPYSAGSRDFANYYLPDGLSVGEPGGIRTIEVGDRLYRQSREVRLRRSGEGWTLETATDPWVWPRLDAKAAREALKASKYHDFKLWANAVKALSDFRDRPVRGLDPYTNGSAQIVGALGEPERWLDVMLSYSYTVVPCVDDVCERVRMAVYVAHKVITVETHDYIHREDLGKVRRDRVKYNGSVRGYV